MKRTKKISLRVIRELLGIFAILAIAYMCFSQIEPKVKEVVKEVEVEKEIIVTKEVPVEKIVEKEVFVEKEKDAYYKVTNTEREMIARLLYREGGATSVECQKMIVSVIFNRYDAANGEKTLEEIIYQKGQFQPAHLIGNTTPLEVNYEVVDEIIMNGPSIPHYVKYFRAGYHFDWEGYVGYTELDNCYFGYLTRDIK